MEVHGEGVGHLPILMSYVAFGSKYFPERVFPDGQPREMKEMYPAPSWRSSSCP